MGAEPDLYPKDAEYEKEQKRTTKTTTTLEEASDKDDDSDEEKEPLDPCIVEEGVDYQTSKALFAMEHIATRDICRRKCQRESRCGAWTWGSTRNTWGLTNMCFLKELGLDQRPHREENPKVTSGLACRKEKK